ncbi:MAG: hypothetical protein K8U57_01300 [Planctomycetes bacterium]|nr:hypothetical protein [Planctomycetota bacterium]
MSYPTEEIAMTVSMGLTNRLTGEYRHVPISTSGSFRDVWIPLCNQIGLIYVPDFEGGAFTHVPPELIPDIVKELSLLAEVVVAREGYDWIAERIAEIIQAFKETNPDEWEYDFG